MGLYIHVPFCGSICSYCHFSRTADHQPVVRLRYVQAVVQEFELRRRNCSILEGSRELATAYIGGGTPSELEPELMEEMLAGTVGQLKLSPDFEFTCEANPESFHEDLAVRWLGAGVNRISLGVQSLDDNVLKLLGRSCSPDTARRALALACDKFERVSADWIIGPGLKQDALLAELREAIALGVEHFSLYILELHQGTRLFEAVARGKLHLPADEHTEKLYLAAVAFLADQGIKQYEVSNFARPGAESRHNRNYWLRRPWLGLGPSAHGCYGPRRYGNIADLDKYCHSVENQHIPEEMVDPVSVSSRLLERIILALRTGGGLPLEWLADGCLDLQAGMHEGLWQVENGFLKLTAKGFLVIDGIEEKIQPRSAG